jgi:hypothetical protein
LQATLRRTNWWLPLQIGMKPVLPMLSTTESGWEP